MKKYRIFCYKSCGAIAKIDSTNALIKAIIMFIIDLFKYSSVDFKVSR